MSAYSDEILATPGLVSYWRLGEAVPGTGTAADEKAANNGTYVGSPPSIAGLLRGDANPAVDFNGSTQRVSAVDAASLESQTLSVELWAQPDTTTAGTRWMVQKSGAVFSYYVFQSGANMIGGVNTTLNDFPSATHTGGLAATVARHWVVTWDGSTVLLYRDGVQVATSATAARTLTYDALGLAIAANTAGTERFDGKLDEVAFYNVALTPAQIKRHYAIGMRYSMVVPSRTVRNHLLRR